MGERNDLPIIPFGGPNLVDELQARILTLESELKAAREDYHGVFATAKEMARFITGHHDADGDDGKLLAARLIELYVDKEAPDAE